MAISEPQPADLPELDADELATLVAAARAEKAKRQRDQAYWQKIYAPIVMPSPDRFGNWLLAESSRYDKKIPNPRYVGPDGFELNEHNQNIFDLLCLYFTNNQAFERAGELFPELAGSADKPQKFSLQKGIALFGPMGCGKTQLLKLFSANPRQSYAWAPCKLVANNYKSAPTSAEGEELYHRLTGRADIYNDGFRGTTGGRAFDDLGVEPIPVKCFGNERSMMLDILERRYELGPEQAGLTHLTTNLTTQQIEEIYGARIRSRMREMFNIIRFSKSAPDRRQ